MYICPQRGAAPPGRGAHEAAPGGGPQPPHVAVRAAAARPPRGRAPGVAARRAGGRHGAAGGVRVLPPRPALQQVAPRLSVCPLPALGGANGNCRYTREHATSYHITSFKTTFITLSIVKK